MDPIILTFTHLDNSESPIHLTCMSMDYWRFPLTAFNQFICNSITSVLIHYSVISFVWNKHTTKPLKSTSCTSRTPTYSILSKNRQIILLLAKQKQIKIYLHHPANVLPFQPRANEYNYHLKIRQDWTRQACSCKRVPGSQPNSYIRPARCTGSMTGVPFSSVQVIES